MGPAAGANALHMQPVAPDAARHADVLAAIDAQQRGTMRSTTFALTLLVSLALFLGAGAAARWTVTVALVPVLLFHELGHYVAMRVFGYRNLRMFFIPFFGAAVSGRNYNVAGWKKAIVSLMGPVPGVIVGGAIGLLGPGLGLAWARETAILLLVLNGLNLLPLLPLDGGWVMHTLLFSRHYRSEAAFQLVAAAALAAAGIGLGDPVLGFLAAFLLGSARTNYQLARMAHELRAAGLAATSPDDQTIPPAAAAAIIDRVQEAFPAANARTVAQRTLHVFGAINARPPAWPVALALGAGYLGSLTAALLFLAAVVIGPGEIAATVRRQMPPAWSLDAGAVRAPARASFPAADGGTIVATFRSPTAARDAFVALQDALPADADAALFGQSLLVARDSSRLAASLPGADEMLAVTPDRGIGFTLSCTARSEPAAEALAVAVNAYFYLPPSLSLIPPWASPDDRSSQQRARHQRARTTFLRLEAAGVEVYGSPRWQATMDALRAARAAGDEGREAALRAHGRRQVREAQINGIAALRDAAGGELDLEVVDRYTGLLAATPPEQELDGMDWTPLAPLLGALPVGGSGGQLASTGDAWAAGRQVRVEGVKFADLFRGPAALAAWLRANGCAEPRYHYRTEASERPHPS